MEILKSFSKLSYAFVATAIFFGHIANLRAESAAERFNGQYKIINVTGNEKFIGPFHDDKFFKSLSESDKSNMNLATNIPLYSTYSTVHEECPDDLYVSNSKDPEEPGKNIVLLSKNLNDANKNNANLYLHDETVSSDVCDKYNWSAAECILTVKIPGAFEKWSYSADENSIVNEVQTGRILNAYQFISLKRDGDALVLKKEAKDHYGEYSFICHYQKN